MLEIDVIEDRGPQANAQRNLTALEARITRQRDALLTLTTQKLDCGELTSALARILEVTSETLGASRVSIWRYDSFKTAINCLDLYDSARRRHLDGLTLTAVEFPMYFRALEQAEIVAADDARTDPRTAEFTGAYLVPLGITSMMDVPIHIEGKVIGVLCHEHVGPPRRWTDDEKSFAIGVSNVIALAFERCERSRAESALLLQGAALNAAALGVIITDINGSIEWTNRAFTALTGYSMEEALGRNPRELLNSGLHSRDFYAEMWKTLGEGRTWRGELTNRRKDGSTYLEELTITPVRAAADGSVTHYVGIKRDLTEHRKLEDQFLQAQKMEVVGRLAGGIAHDFNNMLTVINGSAELAIGDLPDHHPIRHDLERIHESGLRAASLTRQLLAFSRKELLVRKPLSVAKSLTEFRSILQRLIGEDVKLTVEAEGAGMIVADASQFEQVVLNLAVNARDAMPMGGQLRIQASNVDLDDAVDAVKKAVVRIVVTDTGCGIPPETLPRIFEPFFTTKEQDKGTGLGLSTVYGVIQQCGGAIEVTSIVGSGTTFTIDLPRVDGQDVAAERHAAPPRTNRGETILLVEDESDVRAFAQRVLRTAGYRVMSAASAGEALKLLRDEPGPVDLVVTDVVLPGAGGLELASTATVMRPGLRVLYTSGYTDDTVLAHGVEQNTVEFLPKPFSPAALQDKVRAILARPSADN